MIKLKTSQRFRKETYIELHLPTATDNLIQEPSLGGQHIAPPTQLFVQLNTRLAHKLH
ncbi:hypothetical protein D3C81_2165150 [compost metagenome]